MLNSMPGKPHGDWLSGQVCTVQPCRVRLAHAEAMLTLARRFTYPGEECFWGMVRKAHPTN